MGPKDYSVYIERNWPTPTDEAYRVAKFHMELYEQVRATGVPNYMAARVQIPSQLNCDAWDASLADYEDREICLFLRYGWPVTYTAPQPPVSTAKNHASALRHPKDISTFIHKECGMEAMLGPFCDPPFSPWTKISPLMTRDKPSGGGKRVIIDLSFPPGASVNDGVLKNFFQGRDFNYTLPTPFDLAEEILQAGQGAFMWKADLQRAYRQLRIDPLDYPLLAIRHNDNCYIDVCPSFGCRCSGGAMQRTSNAVVHLMNLKDHKVLAYVDDFASVSPTFAQATQGFADFEALTSRLGLKLAADKTEYPTTALEFLGLHFDTRALTITIPEARLKEVTDEASKWLTRDSAPKQEVQSLAGKLNFISTCVRPGRKFMGRILGALRDAHGSGIVAVGPHFKKDMTWFTTYAARCNRRVMIAPKGHDLTIECDACLRGGGGWSDTHFYSVVFDRHFSAGLHISQLEALNVVEALKSLVPKTLRAAKILVRTDNIAAMYALNTGRTHDPVLASCAREIWLLAALQDLDVLLVHIPGVDLVLADALSRRSFDPALDRLAISLVAAKKLTAAKPVPTTELLSPLL